MADSILPPNTVQSPPKFERDDEFASLYANHIWYETTVWDLKLIFGQLDQTIGPNVITQHTAIALTWLQVKIMSYYLQANLAIYEAGHGTIKIPSEVLPPEPPAPSENDQVAKMATEKIQELRKRLIAENL